MSVEAHLGSPVAPPAAAGGETWGLWVRQAWAVARLEIGRNLIGLRALGVYVVAVFPVGILLLAAWLRVSGREGEIENFSAGVLTREYSVYFATLFAHVVIFFVCLVAFTRLFRAEIQQRSLHYYFLTPVRREVLVAGKFAAAWAVTAAVLSVTTTLSFLFHYLPLTRAAGSESYSAFMLRGGGLGHLAGYLGVTLLGVLGYGAVFLAAGLFVRNPIVPALLVFGWEAMNFLLPPLLKRISVIHYLQALQPVPPPDGLLALLAEPPSPWLAVPGLLLVSAGLIALAAWRLRGMEIEYGEE